MKKFTKILALSLVLIMSVMMFASCTLFGPKPAKNPEKAKDALKDNGYEVELIDDKDELKEHDYDGLVAVVDAYDEDDEYAFITIYYFEKASDAKDAVEELEDELEDTKEQLEEHKDYLGDEYEKIKKVYDNAIIGRSGKVVWIATSEDIIKDAK